MQSATLFRHLLGVEKTVVENVQFVGLADSLTNDDERMLVLSVRPNRQARHRCGRCGKRGRVYDQGQGKRQWRSLDIGSTKVFLEADAPRITCRKHGVVVAAVPWARHDAGHTRDFDETVAWMATRMSKSAVREFMRVAWRTVGSIMTRVWADGDIAADRFAGLTRIGIDEISYKRGHKYITVVVDHDSGRLVWAAPGRDMATLRGFFDELGEARSAEITHVSADQAQWIADVVTSHAPNAVLCADPFHIVAWATDALDIVRRQAWNDARAMARNAGKPALPGHPNADGGLPVAAGQAKSFKGARHALWKNPENLTDNQRIKLTWIASTDPKLYRAYLLKEGLRVVFQLPLDAATQALDRWIGWARRCRIPAFVKLQKSIVKHRVSILAAIEHGLSNGRVESMNTKIRLITRMAYGFKSPEALIALAMLSLGGQKPVLPGRK